MLPSGMSWEAVQDAFPDGEPKVIRPFDDAELHMEWYVPGGAVATRCGELGLYSLRCEGYITCVACLGHG